LLAMTVKVQVLGPVAGGFSMNSVPFPFPRSLKVMKLQLPVIPFALSWAAGVPVVVTLKVEDAPPATTVSVSALVNCGGAVVVGWL